MFLTQEVEGRVVICKLSVSVVWQELYKPPEMQLEAFALVFAFQAGRSGAKLVAKGHLKAEHRREITALFCTPCRARLTCRVLLIISDAACFWQNCRLVYKCQTDLKRCCHYFQAAVSRAPTAAAGDMVLIKGVNQVFTGFWLLCCSALLKPLVCLHTHTMLTSTINHHCCCSWPYMVSYSMLLKGSWGPGREPLLSEMFLTQDTLRNADGDAQQSGDADITITITGETVLPWEPFRNKKNEVWSHDLISELRGCISSSNSCHPLRSRY